MRKGHWRRVASWAAHTSSQTSPGAIDSDHDRTSHFLSRVDGRRCCGGVTMAIGRAAQASAIGRPGGRTGLHDLSGGGHGTLLLCPRGKNPWSPARPAPPSRPVWIHRLPSACRGTVPTACQSLRRMAARTASTGRRPVQRPWPGRGNRRALHAAPPRSGQALDTIGRPAPVDSWRWQHFGRGGCWAVHQAARALGHHARVASSPANHAEPEGTEYDEGREDSAHAIEAVDRLARMSSKRMPAAHRDRLPCAQERRVAGSQYGSTRPLNVAPGQRTAVT